MGHAKIFFLVILGIFAAIGILYPASIILGLMFFVVPGIILLAAPTAFVYYAGALILGGVLKFLKIPFPVLISLILLLGVGCLISHSLNRPIIDRVNEYKNHDLVLNGEFHIPDTIAIYSDHYRRYEDACNELCQLLLFNAASKQVLIITDLSKINDPSNANVTSYTLENSEHCNSDNIPPDRFSELTRNVENRIAGGECIVKGKANLLNADSILILGKIIENKGYQDYKSLKRRIVFIKYVELLKNTGNKFERNYRFSQITAQPFVYPLSAGIVLGAGGGSFSINPGFFHYTSTVNNPGSSYGDPLQEYKPQIDKLLSKALKPIEASKLDVKSLIKNAMANDAPDKTAGLNLLDTYLADIHLNKKTPTDDDMQLVLTALKENKIEDLYPLAGFVGIWAKKRGDVPDELIKELANKILRRKSVESAAHVIRILPEGKASSIYPELLQITRDVELRARAHEAIVRLGDGQQEAVTEYIKILEEYGAALGGYKNIDQEKVQALGNAPIGAMIGLCRLGVSSLPAQNILFAIIDEERASLGTNRLAIDALLAIGLIDELNKRYESNEYMMKAVRQSTKEKSRAEKRGQSFCGR